MVMEDGAKGKYRRLKRRKAASLDGPRIQVCLVCRRLQTKMKSCLPVHFRREEAPPPPAPPTHSPQISPLLHRKRSASVRYLPSSPPSTAPFKRRLLGDWARSKKLEEVLCLFPASMTLTEFSHLSPCLLPPPGCLCPPSMSPLAVTTGDTASLVLVTDLRLKEKVLVAITAARAARLQADLAEHGTTMSSPGSMSPHRGSMEGELLGGFLHPSGRGVTSRLTSSTRSLSAIGRPGLSQEDVRRSAGNIQSLGHSLGKYSIYTFILNMMLLAISNIKY